MGTIKQVIGLPKSNEDLFTQLANRVRAEMTDQGLPRDTNGVDINVSSYRISIEGDLWDSDSDVTFTVKDRNYNTWGGPRWNEIFRIERDVNLISSTDYDYQEMSRGNWIEKNIAFKNVVGLGHCVGCYFDFIDYTDFHSSPPMAMTIMFSRAKVDSYMACPATSCSDFD